MAANGSTIHFGPRSATPVNGPYSQAPLKLSNSVAGMPLPRNSSSGFVTVFKIPPGSTMTTGLTFDLVITDDGSDSSDLGKVVTLGVTAKKLTSGTDTLDIGTGAGTEVTADVTLSATTGVVITTGVAVANANLDSAGAGDWVIVRIRRTAGTNDTARGPVLLVAADAYAY